VTRFLKQKGRVNKSELLAEANRVIRLAPREEDRARIAQEQKSLLEKVEKQFVQEQDEDKDPKKH
jgi:hypothetical protein